MSEGTTPKPAKKKPKKPKRKMDHPKYIDMIVEAIENLQEKKGSSRQAIVKYVRANYKIGDEHVEIYVKNALKMGLKYDRLKLATGRGVSGSFRVGEPKSSGRKKRARAPAAAKTLKKTTKKTKRDIKSKSKAKVKKAADTVKKSKKSKAKGTKSKKGAKRATKAKPKAGKQKGKK